MQEERRAAQMYEAGHLDGRQVQPNRYPSNMNKTTFHQNQNQAQDDLETRRLSNVRQKRSLGSNDDLPNNVTTAMITPNQSASPEDIIRNQLRESKLTPIDSRFGVSNDESSHTHTFAAHNKTNRINANDAFAVVSNLTKRSSQIRRSSGVDGYDGQAQVTEFSEQSSTMEAMLQQHKQRQLRIITSNNFNMSMNSSSGGTKVFIQTNSSQSELLKQTVSSSNPTDKVILHPKMNGDNQ